MKSKSLIGFVTLFFCCLLACNTEKTEAIPINDVSPWCIIGFDSADRSPLQRIEMLKDLGLSKYGFNKGKGDLGTMKAEFKLANDHNIAINSIFIWLNAKRDSIGKLSPSNLEILKNLKEIEAKPTLWVSFSDNYFEGKNQEASVLLATDMIKYIKTQADEIGCKVALYNHHGWFGHPYNQLEILSKLDVDDITMVYNFHHAQSQVDEFSEIAERITPHLSYVNLSGVKKEGPQIITIGKGDYELQMIQLLIDQNYNGPWGILGHLKSEDVEVVLKRNIEGLNWINKQLKNSK